MEVQGDLCRVEVLGERGSISAVGFDMCQTLPLSGRQGLTHRQQIIDGGLSTRGACYRFLYAVTLFWSAF
jgi:hypothetical protein